MNSPPNDLKRKAAEIADQLDERNPDAIAQIERIVERLGAETAASLLRETLEIEAKGGMTVIDGSRHRTAGGVYLYLAKGQVSRKDRYYIWPGSAPQRPPKFDWDERLKIIPGIITSSGEVRTVKITLIGRPGRIVEKGNVILTTMQSRKAPPLPKDLPKPPEGETTYVVFIARKQWRRVAEAIQDPEDDLIVEGYPAFDQRLKAMTVFAIHTTTKALQAARREAQKE